MKAQELRLGNIIALDTIGPTGAPYEIILRVGPIEIRDADYYGDDWTGKPIPLTSEWLERFGFERDRYRFKHCGDMLECFCVEYLNGCFVEADTFTRVDHVHTLQNLYFALKGSELTIKESL